MRKGKVNWIPVEEIKKIAPDLDTSDFKDIEPYYDAIEEHMLEQGFVLWDDPIEFESEVTVGGYHELRYNCAVVKGTRRSDKFIIKEVGVAYQHIKTTPVTDLDKLSYALNHLTAYTVHGVPDKSSVEAQKYLKEYIAKMRELGVKNLKQLLK